MAATRVDALNAFKDGSVLGLPEATLREMIVGIAAFTGQGPVHEKQDGLMAQSIVLLLQARQQESQLRQSRLLSIVAIAVSVGALVASIAS